MIFKIFLFSILLVISQLSISSHQTNFRSSDSSEVNKNYVPEWAKGIVWYQIFPERFANGDIANDPESKKVFINSDSVPAGWKITEWTDNWFNQSEWEKQLGGSVRDHLYERRYGGDIQGIINKLDYLKDLGIGAIYLNPVFEAPSLHKYDGSTFHHIDVNFGPDPERDRLLINNEIPDDPSTWKWTSADSLFLCLIKEVHNREMKIIIDGVFNHTGREFWAFKDIKKNRQNSKYKDWYNIERFDDPTTFENEFEYKGWWGVKSLPEINKTETDLNIGPKEYIYHSTKRWMDPNADENSSDGIDGWRLDVAREVPIGFWNDWSTLVKNLNSDAIIIGELWELSPDFVSGDGPFDALMNYEFAFAVNDYFIAKKNAITTKEIAERLSKINETYPEENLHVLQNLVGSHDTERLSSMIKNPDRAFDRDANEGNENYSPGKPDSKVYDIQKLILAFQMTYQGAPMIYYGDEVGMWGADDPHCRKPMIWKELNFDNEVIDETSGFKQGFGSFTVEPNEDLLMFYKKLISIRNSANALKVGAVNFIYFDENNKSFVFERTYDSEKCLVAFNLSEESCSIDLTFQAEGYYTELISNEKGKINSQTNHANFNINLQPLSVRIYWISSEE